jgi:hypothetical protein
MPAEIAAAQATTCQPLPAGPGTRMPERIPGNPDAEQGPQQDPTHQWPVAAEPARLEERRGNPNLALAPRCGARTRSGCPCQAPAIRGGLRCRMHGGRSTGPRTPDGMARLRAARTTHGSFSAEARAWHRHILMVLRRGRIWLDAVTWEAHLPAEMVERLNSEPPELMQPPYPSGGLTRSEERAIMRAEAAALAPWQQAIAVARQAGKRSPATRLDSADAMVAAEALAPGRQPVAEAVAIAPAYATMQPEVRASKWQSIADAAAAPTDPILRPEAHTPEPQPSPDNGLPALADATVHPDAVAPERQPVADVAPTLADAAIQSEAHAPERQPVTDRPLVPADGTTLPEGPAPAPRFTTRPWNMPGQIPGTRSPASSPGRPIGNGLSLETTLRRQLLAGSSHDTSTILADRPGGWDAVALCTALHGADGVRSVARRPGPRTDLAQPRSFPGSQPGAAMENAARIAIATPGVATVEARF